VISGQPSGFTEEMKAAIAEDNFSAQLVSLAGSNPGQFVTFTQAALPPSTNRQSTHRSQKSLKKEKKRQSLPGASRQSLKSNQKQSRLSSTHSLKLNLKDKVNRSHSSHSSKDTHRLVEGRPQDECGEYEFSQPEDKRKSLNSNPNPNPYLTQMSQPE
jgi:hypothetical protein